MMQTLELVSDPSVVSCREEVLNSASRRRKRKKRLRESSEAHVAGEEIIALEIVTLNSRLGMALLSSLFRRGFPCPVTMVVSLDKKCPARRNELKKCSGVVGLSGLIRG